MLSFFAYVALQFILLFHLLCPSFLNQNSLPPPSIPPPLWHFFIVLRANNTQGLHFLSRLYTGGSLQGGPCSRMAHRTEEKLTPFQPHTSESKGRTHSLPRSDPTFDGLGKDSPKVKAHTWVKAFLCLCFLEEEQGCKKWEIQNIISPRICEPSRKGDTTSSGISILSIPHLFYVLAISTVEILALKNTLSPSTSHWRRSCTDCLVSCNSYLKVFKSKTKLVFIHINYYNLAVWLNSPQRTERKIRHYDD